MQNPKTSLTAYATMIAVLLAKFGLHVTPDTITVILGVGVLLLGHFAHDAQGKPSAQPPAPPTTGDTGSMLNSLLNKTSASAVALFLCLALVASSTGCKINPPSRATLEKLSNGGHTIANVLEVNETAPDQLLAEGVINQSVHDELVKDIGEAKGDANMFNQAMDEVLKNPKADLKPLVPLVLSLVKRIHALNRTDIPGWNAAFTLAEVGLSFIANYFAITISKLHKLGFSDEGICALAGVTYEPGIFRLIENYSQSPASGADHAGSTTVGE